MKKRTIMGVVAILFIVASFTSCLTSYEKVATDTERTAKERALLGKACHEEFPPEVKFIEGKTVRDTTVEYQYFDQSLLVDSLAVVTQDQAEVIKAKSDSLAKMKVARVIITVHRVDTLRVSDSAEIQRHIDRENALSGDLVTAHSETLQMGVERDRAIKDATKERGDANFWRWYGILVSVAFVCYIFRKPLLRGVIAIFNPIKI